MVFLPNGDDKLDDGLVAEVAADFVAGALLFTRLGAVLEVVVERMDETLDDTTFVNLFVVNGFVVVVVDFKVLDTGFFAAPRPTVLLAARLDDAVLVAVGLLVAAEDVRLLDTLLVTLAYFDAGRLVAGLASPVVLAFDASGFDVSVDLVTVLVAVCLANGFKFVAPVFSREETVDFRVDDTFDTVGLLIVKAVLDFDVVASVGGFLAPISRVDETVLAGLLVVEEVPNGLRVTVDCGLVAVVAPVAEAGFLVRVVREVRVLVGFVVDVLVSLARMDEDFESLAVAGLVSLVGLALLNDCLPADRLVDGFFFETKVEAAATDTTPAAPKTAAALAPVDVFSLSVSSFGVSSTISGLLINPLLLISSTAD